MNKYLKRILEPTLKTILADDCEPIDDQHRHNFSGDEFKKKASKYFGKLFEYVRSLMNSITCPYNTQYFMPLELRYLCQVIFNCAKAKGGSERVACSFVLRFIILR